MMIMPSMAKEHSVQSLEAMYSAPKLNYEEVSAETSWSTSMVLRDKNRLRAAQALLYTITEKRAKAAKERGYQKAVGVSWEVLDIYIYNSSQTKVRIPDRANRKAG